MCSLLTLPQELRDEIYSYALDDPLPCPETFLEVVDESTERHSVPSVFGIDVEEDPFRTYIPKQFPTPTWQNLSLCCRQARNDVKEHFASLTTQKDKALEAELELTITSTTATAMWISFPAPPRSIERLNIDVKLSHIWDRDVLNEAPRKDNRIVRVLFDVLKRYIANGPNLLRSDPLSKPLYLDSVVLNVRPAWTTREIYGEPRLQMMELHRILLAWLKRLAKSRLLSAHVGNIGSRLGCFDDEDEEVIFSVTDDDVCDDFKLFKNLRYIW